MDQPQQRGQHRRVALACVIFFATMFGMAYAAVPFYDWFCKTTGFAGTPKVALQAPAQAIARTITIRFDANIASDLPWNFTPEQNTMQVKLGEQATAYYIAQSTSNEETFGTASYNVSPDTTGGYFNKIQCFCFTSQAMKPHEKRRMAVNFFVDPEMDQDRELKGLDTITLSYTFYSQAAPLKAASIPAR